MNQEIKQYIKIGLFNTLVTYFMSGIVYSILQEKIGIIYSGIISSIICIKFSFWMQKIFVFNSSEYWVKEYLKSNLGYAGISGISILMMYILIKMMDVNVWLSQALTQPVVILLSYSINKNFTFKKRYEKD